MHTAHVLIGSVADPPHNRDPPNEGFLGVTALCLDFNQGFQRAFPLRIQRFGEVCSNSHALCQFLNLMGQTNCTSLFTHKFFIFNQTTKAAKLWDPDFLAFWPWACLTASLWHSQVKGGDEDGKTFSHAISNMSSAHHWGQATCPFMSLGAWTSSASSLGASGAGETRQGPARICQGTSWSPVQHGRTFQTFVWHCFCCYIDQLYRKVFRFSLNLTSYAGGEIPGCLTTGSYSHVECATHGRIHWNFTKMHSVIKICYHWWRPASESSFTVQTRVILRFVGTKGWQLLGGHCWIERQLADSVEIAAMLSDALAISNWNRDQEGCVTGPSLQLDGNASWWFVLRPVETHLCTYVNQGNQVQHLQPPVVWLKHFVFEVMFLNWTALWVRIGHRCWEEAEAGAGFHSRSCSRFGLGVHQ